MAIIITLTLLGVLAAIAIVAAIIETVTDGYGHRSSEVRFNRLP
ncbi:hypothetical protein [Subtercola frigoramans]|uniref:Uncharacterized protein n=1 Tax=Subtercola frigoramans TaxID=120298 RepID=A0ABS2L2J3_9MICO|nr:hypothetical protein [Subtercola frigoramans]MBM7470975.1 hypothetical protein [Subtercola frigoramans]